MSSHNLPYWMFPPETTETPPPDYDSQRAAVGAESDFYGLPQSTPSSARQRSPLPSPPPSSSYAFYGGQVSDVALGLLQSYGLEPTDLVRLAEMPEEMLNLDSLPQLLRDLKEGRNTDPPPLMSLSIPTPRSTRRATSPCPAAAPVSSSSSSSSPPAVVIDDKWAQIRNQPVQYPLGHILSPSESRSSERLSSKWPDHRVDPRPPPAARSYKHLSGTETPLAPPPPSFSSSSSCYVLDYGHQGRSADQGKQRREERYESPSHSQPASGRIPPPRYPQSDSTCNYGSGLPRQTHRAQPRAERRWPDPLPHSRGGTGQALAAVAAPAAPSRKEALDFHGSPPGAFPYSCSLCAIMAQSDKQEGSQVWQQHINGSQHADKQLALLQRYPAWDCRLEKKSRFEDQPAKPKDNPRPGHRPQASNEKPGFQPNAKRGRKSGEEKVLCARFESQSVGEDRLRALIEPFGKIVQVLMFPSLAFVEMGSSSQAMDLDKYYRANPAAGQVTFQISSSFNFLPKSRVLSFTPAPKGEDGFSDLLSVVKRFGPPLYTLALPSLVFVEMKEKVDAQNLVEYYSTNSLKINGDVLKVTFSAEYKTLMRLTAAKKYEEQGAGGSSVTKKSRSPSPRRKESRQDGRQGSRQRHSASDMKSLREEKKAVVVAATAPAPSGPTAEVETPASSDPETSQAGPTQDPVEVSDEESDIEGMAVIGEDGEIKVKEEPDEISKKERTSGPEPKKLKKERGQEPDIMVLLENCITLDELGEEDEVEEESDDEDKQEEGESKGIYFQNLPSVSYTDTEFVDPVKVDGNAVQNVLVPDGQESSIQMSSCSEALLASRELGNNPGFKGSVSDVALTHRYPGLSAGGKVLSDPGPEEEVRWSSSPARASEKEGLNQMTSHPVESIPQPAGTEESSQVSPEEEEKKESASSRKCSSEEPEVPHKEEEETTTLPQEVDGVEEMASDPESKDHEEPDREGVVETTPTPDVCAEFVRPVVGYFCNLCEVIYVDEDEAKTTHCSSLTHYQKYKEHTGRDPWSS
ncbi:hypothetical protein NHX12_010855 [Muraenolepis orangiensis]|uniref:U1-type domain-containing protein n=1 Tax=Muraenolepis orangiensis TaxID=630683 RepID=A0A9Q0DFB1_9TELE|nr:hypothetical protein NHX12_010855 [Muraenolepis orangiensis]